METVKPSELEMQILSVLWQKGDSTAREVLEAMPDGKERAYTSVLSVMQVMEKKGLLTHTNRGTAHVYCPAVQKNKIIQTFMRKILNEVFGGKPSAMMQALMAEAAIDDREMQQIKKIIKDAKNKNSEK
jgi:BlaI family transcriptional regulator, penicillinase repressor